MTTPREIPRPLLPACYDALCEHSKLPRTAVHVAYQKWQRSAPPDPCRYGAEKPIALECTCRGCVESLCFFFFDQVANKFHTEGFTS